MIVAVLPRMMTDDLLGEPAKTWARVLEARSSFVVVELVSDQAASSAGRRREAMRGRRRGRAKATRSSV